MEGGIERTTDDTEYTDWNTNSTLLSVCSVPSVVKPLRH
jgi:hypothetical protein